MSHFVGCMWIFIGISFQEDEIFGDSWIEASGFDNMSPMQLYATSAYFTMQTLTTVGYGDINIVRVDERIMVIFL